jgi:hypothetical protein
MRERRGFENGGESPPSLLSPTLRSPAGSSSGKSNGTEPLFSDPGSSKAEEEARNASGVSWEVIESEEVVWRWEGTEEWERVSDPGTGVKKDV